MSETVQIKTPWLASKDPEVPSTLNYSTLSMCGRVEEMVRQYPNYIAYEFMGKTTTYAEMWQKINACAKSLKAIGIRVIIRLLIPSASATSCWVSFRFSRSALNFSPNVILVITPVHKKFATSNCASLLTKALEVRIIMTEQSNYS